MKNKILGSALLIAGSTIGAGMLAMPLTSAELGFGVTAIILLVLWALLAYTGLLFMEVYQTAPVRDVGVASLAEQYFGLIGRLLATLSPLILLYAILAAYMSGGSSLLSPFMPIADEQTRSQISVLLITLVLGAFVLVGVKGVDGATRLMFIGKIAAFVAILALMLPKVEIENLTAAPINPLAAFSVVPVFFTAFGFHVIMGSINAYLEADIRKIRLSMYIGTAIPLITYLLWQLATHGVLTQSEFMRILGQDATLNGLVKASMQISGSQIIGEIMRIFSALALITSFLGVAMGIMECLTDLLKRFDLPCNRTILAILTFVPPMAFSLFYPNGFIAALGYAGLLFAFYGLMLPVGLAWKARHQHPNLPYKVWGGKPMLVIVFLAGIAIMLIPYLIQAGYLPKVVG